MTLMSENPFEAIERLEKLAAWHRINAGAPELTGCGRRDYAPPRTSSTKRPKSVSNCPTNQIRRIATGSKPMLAAALLEHDLDEKRAGGGNALGKAVVERLHRRDLRAGHAHRAGKTHPVEIGVAEIEHVERLAARIAGPDIGELALEDRVAPVRE